MKERKAIQGKEKKLNMWNWTILVVVTAMFLHITPLWAEKILVDVKGMVCSFCGYSLEKKMGKNPKVKSIKVSLEKQQIKIETKKGKTLTDAEIRKEVKDSGYLVDQIRR